MSLYIEEKNQTLLWNLINKNPLLSTLLPNISQKTQWFKTILSQIYSTLPQSISNEVLLNKNKETLSIMINDLKSRMNQSPIYTRNQKEPTSINSQYEERQKEYESMMKKPTIDEISFKEQLDDGVIKNMDELIQRQLREREQDLHRISQQYQNKPENKPVLDIKETIPKDEIIFEDILIEKKKVSWGTDSVIEIDKYSILEKKIDELNEKYDKLLNYLDRQIPNFSKDFTQRIEIHKILLEQMEILESNTILTKNTNIK